MDKEAQEKIKNILKFLDGSEPAEDCSDFSGWLATEIVQSLESLGYRKPSKDKPPLLSDDKLMEHWTNYDKYLTAHDVVVAIAHAQRESDIKWYEEDNKRGGEHNEIIGEEAQ